MDFFPTGPLTTLYAIILLCSTMGVAAYSRDGVLRNLAVVMFLSWLAARFATYVDAIYIYGIATAVLCLVAVLLGELSRSAVGQKVSQTIAWLFLAKLLICYMPYNLGLLRTEQMWAWSEVAAYLQIIALIGGTLTGGKRFWTRSSTYGNHSPHFRWALQPLRRIWHYALSFVSRWRVSS